MTEIQPESAQPRLPARLFAPPFAPLTALLVCAFLSGGPGAPAALAKGAGGGWDPLISTLSGLVPIAGSIGLLVGLGIWGSAGPNSAQKAAGLGVMGTSVLGLVIGSFAADLAALFTQFI